MVVTEKKGNIHSSNAVTKKIDLVRIEWHETSKRILHKQSDAGRTIILKLFKENQWLSEGDILFEDDDNVVVIDIKECDVISIKTGSAFDIACICYEIGNKHLPLFYQDETLLIPFETPIMHWLLKQGYDVIHEKRKLLMPLRSTVTPHNAAQPGNSLLNRIIKLTTKADE